MSWAIETRGYSQRRACGLVGIDPRVYRYRSTRSDDTGLRQRLRELASERRRFGYRRLQILLKREGVEANWKKVYRLYREERLPSESVAAGNELWERARRWRCRKQSISAGPWTSSPMP